MVERQTSLPDLIGALRRAENWLDRYESQGRAVGEANTKAGLIEPILEGLGWDIENPDEVHREYRRRPSDNPVDYALLLLRTPRLLVEAKGIGEHLDDPKWANQTIAYATAAGVEWVALTNGAEWRVYNSHAPVPLERKLFQVVKLRESLDDAAAVLRLLSKDNMSDNRIAELWKGYFVDQQVHEVLRDLFSGGEPARELVAAVRHRTTDLTLKDIRTSLTRVRATFEFPTVNDPALGRTPPRAPISAGVGHVLASPDGAGSHHRSAEQMLSVADLLAKGLLAAGAILEGTLRDGRKVSATVRADGWLDMAGGSYKYPSGAGAAAKEQAAGHPLTEAQKSTDGWWFWKTKDASGDLVALKELRRRAAETT